MGNRTCRILQVPSQTAQTSCCGTISERSHLSLLSAKESWDLDGSRDFCEDSMLVMKGSKDVKGLFFPHVCDLVHSAKETNHKLVPFWHLGFWSPKAAQAQKPTGFFARTVSDGQSATFWVDRSWSWFGDPISPDYFLNPAMFNFFRNHIYIIYWYRMNILQS